MLSSLILTACISSVFLVFPYGELIHGEPTSGKLTREKSNPAHHENPKSTRTISQENSCKLDTSYSKQNNSCQTKTFQDADILKFKEESHKKVETLQNEKSFQEFQNEVLLKRDEVLKSEVFQADVSAFKKPLEENFKNSGETSTSIISNPGELYIFVSFSLGEKALLNLAHDAKQFGAMLVLRGFKEASYAKTAKALQKIIEATGQGFIIDSELFTLFDVKAVPTFILTKQLQLHASERTQTPLHDSLKGHVSARYALEAFAKEGDLQKEAKALLLRGESE